MVLPLAIGGIQAQLGPKGKIIPEVDHMWGRKSPWAGVNMLDLIPEPLVSTRWDEENQRVILEVPRFREPVVGPLLQRAMPPHRKHFLVPLDSRGSLLWPRMNGARTIGDLAREVLVAFPEDQDQVMERVSKYMVDLYQNKFIRFLNL
ncbi:hypothetical protein CO151_05085 [bacterium CG_4_9_14_3_um_filter_65_15]|nr:MAG: hypothetical protein CO151_05085 [bacterium CG_4_9_14_3_um_filter_65_15]